ncbi:efflux RND transporter periplasmic adaptor subunit [Anaeromyxobacter paludicola]|uniref:RND transporter n=1 Tax=Anaeromyxobacter paludicola TaxID=2918171 RepID=A0ABN6N6U2_9BACT|nr:efflux RND transporter periplasmic adaptor subunit [Anaeromyxobacter paludicola]BDG08912.1 RND transporter [Anaeromyxobacter paludicola]
MTRQSLLALAATLSACSRAASAPAGAPPPPGPGVLELRAVPAYVRVAPVEVSRDGGLATATGRVGFDEDHTSRVGSPLSGRVVELQARPGDRVRRGQPLLAIASPDAESAVADLVAAEADLTAARKNLERSRRLFADQAVPYKDVLQAETDATKAEAARSRARSRLEVLGIDPAVGAHRSRFVLRAPLDGVVVERAAMPGMEVRADSGAPLVTVADLRRLWVQADVYERDLGLASVGQRAAVTVPAFPGETFAGTVTHIGDLVDPQTRTVKVRVEVENPSQRLKPEMFARVTLIGRPGAPAGLTVPADAILSDGQASAVIVAVSPGRFQKRPVALGPEQDGRIRVLSGLSPGDQVVVDGGLYLKAELEAGGAR